MSHFDALVVALLNTRAVRLGSQAAHAAQVGQRLLVLATIQGFFDNLYGKLMLFALAMATFFFALAALLFAASGVTGNERTKMHAVGSLYAALVGLALAALAGTIAGLINDAAKGQ